MAAQPPVATSRRNGPNAEKQDALVALSQQQVNSYPALQQAISLSGEKLVPGTAPSDSEKKAAFLQTARDRFRVCVDAEEKRRGEMRTDMQFRCGLQWDTAIQLQRDSQRRPCLTINRIPGFVKRVVNNMRQERPAIRVLPVGDGTDVEDAEIRQGLIRHVETNSQADVPYDMSFENMCVMGLGWMRVVDDWEDPRSFNQDLFIRAISDTFSVYSDPFVQQPDWSDMKYAFIVEDLTRKEFMEQYPDADPVSKADFTYLGDMGKYWFPGGKIRVAEYFWIEQVKDITCELDNGSTKLWSELKNLKDVTVTGSEPLYRLMVDENGDRVIVSNDGMYSGRTRDTKVPQVKWAKISATQVLKERTWKGRFIPLIPIIGNQLELDGDKIIVGMVRYAREPQRMYNYMYSSFVECVTLAPKAPFIVEVDQIPDGAFPEWQNANSSPVSALRYKHKITTEGDLVPPPQRESANPPIAAFVEGLQMADQNLKAVFSIYEASLGQRGPQESGKAINARKVESDTATYDWGDNFIRGLRYLGIILEDLLPFYYNTPGRVIQIDREDNTKRKITLNQDFQESGETKRFDLSSGKYSVIISTGPSFQTKREQSASSMIEASKAYPPLWQIAGDLMVQQMDWPGAQAISDRLKKALPPGMADDDQGDNPIPPQAQAQIQQLTQQNQQLTQAVNELSDKTALERMKQEYETLRAQMSGEVTLAVAAMKDATAQSSMLTGKIFEELERVRMKLEPELAGATQGSAAQPAAAPQPTLAGAQT